MIRKYAAPLALLAALALAVAAPYMIPANPDSAVFRSGTLGALLIFASFFPVRDALQKASRRELVCGLTLGLLFSAALSIGSELFVYNGLLRGLGSLVRRMAVPVLAAPALGGLCARVLMAAPAAGKRALRLPTAAYAAILFACWLPVLLAFYPGMLNYDFKDQLYQHTLQRYTNLHPLLHSVLANGLIALGEAISGRTLGVLLVSLVQMAFFAWTLGYSCAFAQRRGASAWVSVGMTALYALHPVFSVMSVSMTKDASFAGAVLVFSLMSWELLEAPKAFLENRRRCALYVLMGVLATLLRNNGVFALALMAPALIAVLRGFRKQAAALLCAVAVSCAAVMGALTLAFQPQALPSFQLYSLPAQQLVRAAGSESMSEEDKAEIRSWYVSDWGLRIIPHLADGAKAGLDRPRLQQEGDAFLRLWAKHAKAHAHEYLEAFLMLNVGSWYPDDLSHSTLYSEFNYEDIGYLQLQEYDAQELNIQTRSFLPKLTAFYEQICRRNAYQKYPVVSILFCTATPFWLVLLACARLIADKRSRYLPAALGVLGLWVSYLFGPCTLSRYALPLFCIAPALLAVAFAPKDKPI